MLEIVTVHWVDGHTDDATTKPMSGRCGLLYWLTTSRRVYCAMTDKLTSTLAHRWWLIDPWNADRTDNHWGATSGNFSAALGPYRGLGLTLVDGLLVDMTGPGPGEWVGHQRRMSVSGARVRHARGAPQPTSHESERNYDDSPKWDAMPWPFASGKAVTKSWTKKQRLTFNIAFIQTI